jgi:predicted DNA-binding protein
MATTKRRLNITLSPEAGELVTLIAKRDRVPEATKVSELVNLSLALEEDMAFATLGDARLKEKKIKWLSHKDVWDT